MLSRILTSLLSASAFFLPSIAAPTSNSADGLEAHASEGVAAAPGGGYKNAGYFVNW
jgi:hypothetical protein